MEFDILIFIQAAGDTVYAMDLLEKNKGKRIHLCVVNVANVYKHLKDLSLDNLVVEFFPYVNLHHKNPISIYNAKRSTNKIYRDKFKNNQYREIVFFSRFFDWFTTTVIAKYLKSNKVKIRYLNYNDFVAVKSDEELTITSKGYFARQYYISIVKLITGVRYLSRYKTRTIEFDHEYYKIESEIIKEAVNVPEEYKVRFDFLCANTILFMISPVELDFITLGAKREIELFLRGLGESGYKPVVKGHPRLGIPKELKESFEGVVPCEIPIELIDLTNVKFVLGIVSSGLCTLVQEKDIQVFSLLNVLEFKKQEVVEGYKKFLIERSDNKIKFPNTLYELKGLL
ncbi:hypothetical protein [Plebeiibacterium marinum]|uniref:Uncharacterized protein n=1 Tax=Plebeiibacterium marinum TaxID=2992111 RepID=A0AAE3MDX6_9BACT|nr:hypothetical protein [Plebeiobacterium marinum]MCW3805812.1 hypothetical protein [Plebeiobacterium marinum]